MAEHVGADALTEPGIDCYYIDYLPEPGPGHGCSPVTQKQVGTCSFFEKTWPALFKIVLNFFPGSFTKWNDSLLVSLSQDPNMTARQIAATQRELDKF